MKHITRHLQHYLPLLGILTAGVLGFVLFSYDKNFQGVVAIATAVSYVAWGLIHHYIHDDLHINIILEYVAIAFLGVMIIFSLIFRA